MKQGRYLFDKKMNKGLGITSLIVLVSSVILIALNLTMPFVVYTRVIGIILFGLGWYIFEESFTKEESQ